MPEENNGPRDKKSPNLVILIDAYLKSIEICKLLKELRNFESQIHIPIWAQNKPVLSVTYKHNHTSSM
jgi:hypothetical protein